MRRAFLIAAVLAAALLAATGGWAPAGGARQGTAEPAERLPDLDQVKPSQLIVSEQIAGGRTEVRLGFESAVENVGDGPLSAQGRRASPAEEDMVVDQVIRMSDGTTRTRPGVGVMRYTASPSHSHWHYLAFDRYELRRASDHALVAPDRKTGFCLGDRYPRPGPSLPAKPSQPAWTGQCARDQPQADEVDSGISVGYGDNYPPHLEGQYVEITDVPDGRYVLVHRVNGDGALRETQGGNNAASVLLELGPPSGDAPRTIAPLQDCPETEHCPPPSGGGTGGGTTTGSAGTTTAGPAPGSTPRRATVRDARGLARRVVRTLGGPEAGSRPPCRRTGAASFACRVGWRRGRLRYRGTAVLRRLTAPPRATWSFRVSATRTRLGCRRRGRGSACRTRLLRRGVLVEDR